MSEEQEKEQVQEEEVVQEDVQEEQQEVQEVEQEKPSSLFDALFEAADQPTEEETQEPEEDLGQPITLNEAVDQLLTDEEAEPEEQSEEEEPEGDQEEEAKAEKEEPKKEEPKTTKKKKVKQVVDPEIETEDPAPQYAFPEENPDKEFIDSLLPEEKDIYELAKFASQNMDGFKGKDKQFKDYFEKTKNYIDKRITEDPNVDLSEDEDYRSFIEKNRPDFSQVDIKNVERERNVHEAMRRIEEKQAPEKERARIEQERARKAPQVHKQKLEFREYSTKALPEEFADVTKDQESIKAFAESNPLEFQIVNSITTDLHNLGDLLLDITQGMVAFDESNPVHSKLLSWVNKEQENYIQTGQTQQDGKTFMRRERFFKLPESKRTPYWTWDDADLIAILTMRAKQRIEESVTRQRQILEKSGYAKQVAQPKEQKAKPKAKRSSPPKVASKPRPGNTPNQSPATPAKSAFESVLGM